jgi:predicted dienelactone hydrolase
MTRLLKLFKCLVLTSLISLVALAGFLGYLATYRNIPLQLPAPTGSFPVGRSEFDWIDSARPDPLADQGRAARELVVWVWYPAARAGTTPAPYLPPNWTQARDKDQGAGVLIEKNFDRILTHSYEGSALAPAPDVFPVLVMEPGMGPIATDYTVFAENLASLGYVVVGINPTYTANWTVFPDGRVALRSAKGTIPDLDTPAQVREDGNRILAVWIEDVTFVMDQLAKLNANQAGLFNHRLDLEHIGLWGHSFGGATAITVCQQDSRCKAGVDMDGTPFSEGAQAPIPRPFMFITEDYSRGCDENCADMLQAHMHTQAGMAYTLSITGTRHFNFSDLPVRQTPVFRPLFVWAGYEGSIEPGRALQIVNA